MNSKPEKKKLIQQKTQTIVDHNTGEISEYKVTTTHAVEREPDYIKLYIKDMIKLHDLPKITNSILISILKNMNYDNEIVLVAHVKQRIAKELGIRPNTVDQSLQGLVKKGILTRVGRGVFTANPFLFGRGTWSNVQELRLKITYNKNGTFMIAEIDQQAELDLQIAI